MIHEDPDNNINFAHHTINKGYKNDLLLFTVIELWRALSRLHL